MSIDNGTKLRRRISAWLHRVKSEKKYKTDSEMSKALGLDQSTVSRLMRGIGTPGIEVLFKIHQIAGISADEVLDHDPGEEYLAELERAKGRDLRTRPQSISLPTGKRRFIRIPVNLIGQSQDGSRYQILDVSPGGMRVVSAGPPLHRGSRLLLSSNGSAPAGYAVTWVNGSHAGLKVID